MFEFLLVFLYPASFFFGKVVSKIAEEEIFEVRSVVRFITKVLILSVVFLSLIVYVDFWISFIVFLMLLYYLVLTDESHKEKVILSIVAGFCIVNFHKEVLMLSLIAIFLKGLTLQKINESLFSHKTGLEVSLLLMLLFFKVFIILIF